MTDKTLNVLFLCRSNSTLSIFGEAILNQLGRRRFHAFSAGSDPAPEIDAETLVQLERNNYAHLGLHVNDWRDYAQPDAPVMDFVIVLSADVPGSKQPDWPGNPMITHWHIEDPANAQGEGLQYRAAFVKALKELESRISIFVNLPLESLDRFKLQQRLNAIGKQDNRPGP